MSSLLKAGFKILAGKEKFCAVIDFCGSAHLSGRVWRRGGPPFRQKVLIISLLPPQLITVRRNSTRGKW